MEGLLHSSERLPPTGKGQEDSAPALPPPKVQAWAHKEAFQDLTLSCSEDSKSDSFLYHAPARPNIKGSLGPPRGQSLARPFPAGVGPQGHLVPALKRSLV